MTLLLPALGQPRAVADSTGAFARSRWRPAGWLAVVVLGLGASACSPTFNWRTLRDDGSVLQALMPCKPDSARRDVPLGGAPRSLLMHSCEAGGLTFAVGWVELGQEAAVAEALAQWRAATLATLRVSPDASASQVPGPVTVPGAELTVALQAQGSSPAGQPVQVMALYFAQRTRVYQAAIYGETVPSEVSTSFFEALRLP